MSKLFSKMPLMVQIIWMALKLAIVVFAVFQASNVTILYQGFWLNMRIELAPMEGITTYIYRNAICKYYGGIDTYYSPFISTHQKKRLNFKEIKEILPENNIGYTLIPQVLTANADEFAFTSGQIEEYGYKHINLNFGCPSGTVVPKGKGAGVLKDPDALERLLDAIFSKTNIGISIKTRMGLETPAEWEKLIHVYEKFPIEELIVHARVREDFYNGRARINELSSYDFPDSLKFSYNGDIFSSKDVVKTLELFPYAEAVMIGRGLIARPWLASEIANGNSILGIQTKEGRNALKEFNYALIDGYNKIMPGEKNTLFKLKELWIYLIKSFEREEYSEAVKEIYIPDFKVLPETPKAKKLLKSIRKCNSLREYESIINTL